MAKKLKDLPVGAKVYRPNSKFLGEPVVFQVAHKKSNRIKLITKDIVAFRSFDAKEPKNSNSSRQKFGNDRWLLSNIRQFLNAQGTYQFRAQHDADQAPTKNYVSGNAYENTPGFLSGFEQEFIDEILLTSNVTSIPSTDGGGTEIVKDKVYLPSVTELGLDNPDGVEEGERWGLFRDNISRVAYPTDIAVMDDDTGREKKGEASGYATRTCLNKIPGYYRASSSDGSRTFMVTVYTPNGLRPVLDLSPDISVSDNPNSDGVYTIIFNEEPVIHTTMSSDMGQFTKPFQLKYTVTDKEGDLTTVTEKLNGVIIREETVTLGRERVIELSNDEWQALEKNVDHTLEIIATDSKGAKSTKSFTFVKTNSAPTFTLSTSTDKVMLHHGGELALKGTYQDVDKGDVVSMYYQVDGFARRAIDGGISDGTPRSFTKTLKMRTNGDRADLLDGATLVASNLEKDKTYRIKLWTEDNNGGKSAEKVIPFSVVPNRAPVIEITAVPSAKDLIEVDRLQIKGKASDPDENEVTMTVRIGGAANRKLDVVNGAWTFDFGVDELKEGSNIITFTATDPYQAQDIKQVRVTLKGKHAPAPTDVFRYDLQTPEPIDTLFMWIKHKATTDVHVQASITNGAENFQPIEGRETVSPTGAREKEYQVVQETLGKNASLKFQSMDGITMIMGGMSNSKKGSV